MRELPGLKVGDSNTRPQTRERGAAEVPRRQRAEGALLDRDAAARIRGLLKSGAGMEVGAGTERSQKGKGRAALAFGIRRAVGDTVEDRTDAAGAREVEGWARQVGRDDAAARFGAGRIEMGGSASRSSGSGRRMSHGGRNREASGMESDGSSRSG